MTDKVNPDMEQHLAIAEVLLEAIAGYRYMESFVCYERRLLALIPPPNPRPVEASAPAPECSHSRTSKTSLGYSICIDCGAMRIGGSWHLAISISPTESVIEEAVRVVDKIMCLGCRGNWKKAANGRHHSDDVKHECSSPYCGLPCTGKGFEIIEELVRLGWRKP